MTQPPFGKLRLAGLLLLLFMIYSLRAQAGKSFEIIYEEAGIMGRDETFTFPRWNMIMDKEGRRFDAAVDLYADSGVRTLQYGGWSGTNSFNHPTEVGQLMAEGIPDEMLLEGTLRWKHSLLDYLKRGIDPLARVVNRAKSHGMTVIREQRANNFIVAGTLQQPKFVFPGINAGPAYNGALWYKLPHYRLTDPVADPSLASLADGENPSWDYAKPEVRNFYFRVMQEVLQNYNVDGIAVNFAQNPPFFNKAEPAKAEHMTAFIRALRFECNRVAKKRARPVLLAVIFYEKLWGRHHLADDGIDAGRWARDGLIDRMIVWTHMDPFGGLEPVVDLQHYVNLVQGTRCKLYAACERRSNEDFDKIERSLRLAGYDGVVYFNYTVNPREYHEFRSLNVDYYPTVWPLVAPNPWRETPNASAGLAPDPDRPGLEMQWNVQYWRDPELLPMGGPGITMEARLEVVSARAPGLCGIRIGDGEREATLGISGNRLLLSEAEETLASVPLNSTGVHTIRLTLDDVHLASAYLDGNNQPVMRAQLLRPNGQRTIRWGHFRSTSKVDPRSTWRSLHYTLEGAFSPAQRKFQAGSRQAVSRSRTKLPARSHDPMLVKLNRDQTTNRSCEIMDSLVRISCPLSVIKTESSNPNLPEA